MGSQTITHLLAVDGGATKTAVRLTAVIGSAQREVSHLCVAPSSLTQTKDKGIETIVSAVAQCLNEQAIEPERCAIAIGVAGAGNPLLKQRLQKALNRYPNTIVTTDAHIALLGANAGEPVNCIAIGTGTVASTLLGSHRINCYGGWGFPIADEGGGAWLGQQAIRALISAMEINQYTQLTRYLSATIADNRGDLLQWLQSAKAQDYAIFAPCVFDYSQHCPVAHSVVRRGVEYIEKLLTRCCEGNALPLVFLGGLAACYQPHISPNWRARQIKAKGGALEGATFLASRLGGNI